MSIFDNLITEKQYKASTGLAKAEFEFLLTFFEKYYEPKKPSPYPKVPQPVLTDKAEALFFILHYFKAYPTLENMGLYFGFRTSTVSGYIEKLKPCLKAALQEMGSLPPSLFKSQEEFDKAFEGVRELLVDGSEFPTNRSVEPDYQRFTYSGKKKRHGQKSLLISGADRLIRYVGALWNGRAHDKKMFDHELGRFDFSGKISHVDLGFHGIKNREGCGLVFMPHKKPKGGELTKEQKEENRFLSSLRVRVEHAIGGVKRYFVLKIQNRFHFNKKTYDAIHICAGLWNLKILSS